MKRETSFKLSIVALLVILLAGCGHSRSVPVSDLRQAPLTAKTYTVGKGDTLYSVAWRFNFDYKKLANANAIKKPYTLYVGQVLKLSERKAAQVSAVKKTQKTKKKYTVNQEKGPPVSVASKSSSNKPKKSVQKKTANEFVPSKDKGWLWPVSGKVVKQYSLQNKLSKGIDIAARTGTAIKSSRSGKIVYAGSALKGYGNLIIVRHDDVYLSAYAHNRVLLVKEGTIVKQGQKIAELGSSGTQSPKLHFEIRKKGKPINPLRLLPKQQK